MPYQPEAKPAQAVSEPLPARRGQEPTPYQAELRTLSHAAATTVPPLLLGDPACFRGSLLRRLGQLLVTLRDLPGGLTVR
jgi:hypothetical protein